MIAAFFHDTPLYSGMDEKYYSVNLPYSIWQRYLEIFDKMIVVTRCSNINELHSSDRKGLKESSGENVEFKPVIGYQNFRQINELRKHVIKVLENVDLAIIRLPSTIGLMACFESIKSGKPFAVEVVGCIRDSFWNYGTLKAKLASIPMYILTRLCIKKSSHAIYVTNEFLQNRYPSDGVMFGCSDVSINEPDRIILEKRLRRIKSSSIGKPVNFGLVGSLNVGYKGHETAMLALATLKKDFDFRLRFIGGGNEGKWKYMASRLGIVENVEFCGTLTSGQAVYDWMDDLDIFLIPSLTEGLPRALIEAMSRGLPVIGSSVGGIVELIESEYLHQPKDYKTLATLIKKMVNSSDCMTTQAQLNFKKTEIFTSSILQARRGDFWSQYKYFVSNISKA